MRMVRRSRKGFRKHRLLVDTNILLLYIVGSLGVELIRRHRRTDKFTAEDYLLLTRLLGQFGAIVVTPNILTEVSNLLGYKDSMKEKLLLGLASLTTVVEERHLTSADVVKAAEFSRLGLTDSSIILLAQEDLIVLTDDLSLSLALQRRGIEVINFNHLREKSWE
jgi:rRNA-processing protein FCF1